MKRSKLVVLLSALAVALGGWLTYATRLQPADDPQWLVTWAISHRSVMAIALLVVTSIIALLDFFKAYLDTRHQTVLVLEKILNELSTALFPHGNQCHNRITLFNRTKGWRLLLWGLVRVPFDKPHKWRALFRLRWTSYYLGVYLRPTATKGRKSTAAFRVGDASAECEGVVGLIWDSADQKMLINLPRIDPVAVRRIVSDHQFSGDATVKAYAKATNMLNYRALDACDHFAQHFYGTLILKSDGSPWGVLLLDCFEDTCPFIVDGRPSESFFQRFNDFARIIGKIVG